MNVHSLEPSLLVLVSGFLYHVCLVPRTLNKIKVGDAFFLMCLGCFSLCLVLIFKK